MTNKAINHGLIEVHILKTYPATCLNRDDTGAPKTVYYGGVNRARISSPSIKRAIRKNAPELYGDLFTSVAVRTRGIPMKVAGSLKEAGYDEELAKWAAIIVAGKNSEKKQKELEKAIKEYEAGTLNGDKLLFLSPEEINSYTEAVIKAWDNVEHDIEKFKKLSANDILSLMYTMPKPITIDIALFGRMAESGSSMPGVEAALKVAHAISTKHVATESDYFTAVDDWSTDNGAGHIGDQLYNAATYYEHFVIDLRQLYDNLSFLDNRDEVIPELVNALIGLMCYTDPSGKQNTMEGHVRPDCVYVTHKEKPISTNLINAFKNCGDFYYEVSDTKRLLDKAEEESKMFPLAAPNHSAYLINATDRDVKDIQADGKVESLADMFSAVSHWLA